jgi:hypothetical protein
MMHLPGEGQTFAIEQKGVIMMLFGVRYKKFYILFVVIFVWACPLADIFAAVDKAQCPAFTEAVKSYSCYTEQ